MPSRDLFLRAANPGLGMWLTVTVGSPVSRTIKQTFTYAEIKAIDRGQEWVSLGFNKISVMS
jgi:hypothetical protein